MGGSVSEAKKLAISAADLKAFISFTLFALP